MWQLGRANPDQAEQHEAVLAELNSFFESGELRALYELETVSIPTNEAKPPDNARITEIFTAYAQLITDAEQLINESQNYQSNQQPNPQNNGRARHLLRPASLVSSPYVLECGQSY